MTGQSISFFVPGLPKTAGSKRAFIPKGWKRAIITDDCKGSKDWRGDIKAMASSKAPEQLLAGALSLDLRFVLPRPKAHLNSHGAVKSNAPGWHIKKPDVLKLARAVEDALTGVLWQDDSQIAVETLHKAYGDKPGVTVTVSYAQERQLL